MENSDDNWVEELYKEIAALSPIELAWRKYRNCRAHDRILRELKEMLPHDKELAVAIADNERWQREAMASLVVRSAA